MKSIIYCLSLSIVNSFINVRHFHKNSNIFTKKKEYPISRNYHEESIKRLNKTDNFPKIDSLIIIHHHTQEWNEYPPLLQNEVIDSTNNTNSMGNNNNRDRNSAFKRMIERYGNQQKEREYTEERNSAKSENFEVVYGNQITFKDIGGFESIKGEMLQCVDMLKNWEKYNRFSVRTPKGLILEGPPGNGKTMLARGFAGEAGVGFIAVSGAEFQDKYIGVGSSKIRELFNLAIKKRPCIIFIDEIDALGRKRNDANDGNSERDNTLNQLLVEMDGYRNNSGIFVIGATNRADLLDPALMRAGRIDKRIYIGTPDVIARNFIINIHITGKPNTLTKQDITELILMTNSFSGAQIENLLNEAMLLAIKHNKETFNMADINIIYNRILAGTQSEEHIISDELLERICVHELGHSLLGLYCKHHPLMKKVIINLKSPKTPGMTIFEDDGNEILNTYDALFERISILYGGRIAELLIYGEGLVSTGASTDYNEAREIAQKMVIHYGMGKGQYGGIGERSKEKIDLEVEKILEDAYSNAYSILQSKRDCIVSGSAILKREKCITRRDLLTYLML
jgi:cell division protease FtsH